MTVFPSKRSKPFSSSSDNSWTTETVSTFFTVVEHPHYSALEGNLSSIEVSQNFPQYFRVITRKLYKFLQSLLHTCGLQNIYECRNQNHFLIIMYFFLESYFISLNWLLHEYLMNSLFNTICFIPEFTSDINESCSCSHWSSDNIWSLNEFMSFHSNDISVCTCTGYNSLAFITKYKGLTSDTLGMKEYLNPKGKPAPLLPLSPLFIIS